MQSKRFLGNVVITLCFLLAFVLSIFATSVYAGQAEVVNVKITLLSAGKYRIDTTLKHADTGWDHYANAWLVFDEDGNKIGERVLHHPHVNEQPFTRSLTLTIPANTKNIVIKAQDSVHGINEKGKQVVLPK